jgi:hypothetical protein
MIAGLLNLLSFFIVFLAFGVIFAKMLGKHRG